MPDQMHGKTFENTVKGANGIFTNAASDRQRGPNDRFDVSAEDDIAHGIPTSIKSSRRLSIALSDARRFWESFNYAPYRMLIGLYRQEGAIKVFNEIHEVIVLPKHGNLLLGSISLAQIYNFHDGLREFEKGQHEEARAWANNYKISLEPKRGLVVLNPKIDSGNQRRLQCSVDLRRLIEIAPDDYQLHEESFGRLAFPFKIVSRPRR